MFSFFDTTWYMYGRSRHTDKYTEALHTSMERHDDLLYHMGRFKHEVFMYALGENHESLKSLYLYTSYWRMAKCFRDGDKIWLEFRDSDTAYMWDSCDEVLTSTKFAWKQRPFSNKYGNVTDDHSSCVRCYLRYESK